MGSSEDIVHDGAKQRAWRAAKLREAIDNQTPSEIMEARTGISVPRFGIDGIDNIDDIDEGAAAPQSAFTEHDIKALAKAISETVFLLPEQGIVFTKVQLAKELGVTVDAMLSMTDEGYERLGLVQIKPSR